MRFELLCDEYEKELRIIKQTPNTIFKLSTLAITLSRNLLANFKEIVTKSSFDSDETEIEFFKVTKQIPLVPLIYYSEIHSFETQFPKAGISIQRKYIKKKINNLNRFFIINIDFIQYVESNYTHFDNQYYTRDYLDVYFINSSKNYFQDPHFTSARDMLLGKLMAYNLFTNYLQNRLLVNKKNSANHHNSETINLKWTASKSALTELIYALYHSRSVNNGQIEIKELATLFEQVFSTDLGNYYHTFIEIRARKGSKTKFLDRLEKSLNDRFDESDA